MRVRRYKLKKIKNGHCSVLTFSNVDKVSKIINEEGVNNQAENRKLKKKENNIYEITNVLT